MDSMFVPSKQLLQPKVFKKKPTLLKKLGGFLVGTRGCQCRIVRLLYGLVVEQHSV